MIQNAKAAYNQATSMRPDGPHSIQEALAFAVAAASIAQAEATSRLADDAEAAQERREMVELWSSEA